MTGHWHDSRAGTQNQGNHIGARPAVRQSKLYRKYESGNTMKGLLGQENLSWNVNKQQGAYSGQKVYDHNKVDHSAAPAAGIPREGNSYSRISGRGRSGGGMGVGAESGWGPGMAPPAPPARRQDYGVDAGPRTTGGVSGSDLYGHIVPPGGHGGADFAPNHAPPPRRGGDADFAPNHAPPPRRGGGDVGRGGEGGAQVGMPGQQRVRWDFVPGLDNAGPAPVQARPNQHRRGGGGGADAIDSFMESKHEFGKTTMQCVLSTRPW